jgi:hypothetical protein
MQEHFKVKASLSGLAKTQEVLVMDEKNAVLEMKRKRGHGKNKNGEKKRRADRWVDRYLATVWTGDG